MDALKKAIKVSKKNFYGYLLTKGITTFEQAEFEDFLTKADDKS